MPKKYLILTPLCHNRILKDFKRVKYLGGWCLNVDDSDSSEKTIKYHWDDRKKLASDYIFLDGLYEEFLRKMSRTLNKKHKLNEDNEFWRIIIGPWLGCFLHILFDRFEQLTKAIKDEPEIQIIAFKNLVINKPKDTQDFAKNFIPSD